MKSQEIIKAMMDAMKKDKRMTHFGIRTDDTVFKIGEELPASFDWDFENDVRSDEKLDGTCATGFGYLYFDGDAEDEDAVKKTLEVNSAYVGDHQYLIGGYDSQYGDDENEVIIEAAEVVAIIK